MWAGIIGLIRFGAKGFPGNCLHNRALGKFLPELELVYPFYSLCFFTVDTRKHGGAVDLWSHYHFGGKGTMSNSGESR